MIEGRCRHAHPARGADSAARERSIMMTGPSDPAQEKRLAGLLLDVLIRAGLILALVMLCYRVFSPFLVLMVWALILAVTLYPLHRRWPRRMGGRTGWAATLITVLGVALIVAPTACCVNSMGDSVHGLIDQVQQNTLQIPPPRPGVAEWPVVGPKIHAYLATGARQPACAGQEPAAEDRRTGQGGLGHGGQHRRRHPRIRRGFIIAGIIMAFGEAGDRGQPGDLRAHLRATNAGPSSPCSRWPRSAPSPRA
jgi:hypothetical protein